MTKLYGAPGCDETAVNCLIHERRWTSGESGLEQSVTTFGNLEKFYEAETIYIDRAMLASPFVTQSTAPQHLVHIGSITSHFSIFKNVLY